MSAADSQKLAELTTDELSALAQRGPLVVIVPLGSVEPHGPHLPLDTDAVISETATLRAASALRELGVAVLIAPTVAYGVTNFAQGFMGAISLRGATLTALVRDIMQSLLLGGVSHVCFVNNHLEPAHDAAIREALKDAPPGGASLACPLAKRWGRMLTDEYKSGACHAGEYETSLVLAAGRDVRAEYHSLPSLAVSLSDGIREGKGSFREMGLSRAYTGAPSRATAAEGEESYATLVKMIVTEVQEGLALAATRAEAR